MKKSKKVSDVRSKIATAYENEAELYDWDNPQNSQRIINNIHKAMAMWKKFSSADAKANRLRLAKKIDPLKPTVLNNMHAFQFGPIDLSEYIERVTQIVQVSTLEQVLKSFAFIEFTITGDSINETVKTDDSGNIEIHNLKPGTYTVKEHVAEGYIPQNEQAVTVEAGKTAVVSFSNVTIRGKVELTKVDADYPENKLTGAVFEVYSDTDANGEFDADTDEFVGNMTEAETGVYRMSDLKYGVYFAHEQAAPEGFLQDEGYYRFSIIADGETAVVENKAGVGFINKPVTSKLVITKTDVSNGDLLPGAGFRIKDSDGNVVAEGYTDENGIAEFTLRYGRYTYEEFDAPDGYMIDTEPHEFEITEDGAIIKAEMTNKHQPDIPKTGDNTHIELWATVGVASLIAASGICFRLYRKKKENKD